MEKQTGLPKNIRQIGEIDRERKICLEDYVMTCIRKKEGQESFLGVFFGEKREEEGEIYLYIRGILEAQGENGEELQKRIEEQKKEYFPDWEAVGCCVIGAYPPGRLEQLAAVLPQAGTFLYHLQEQEETLYWREGEKYRSLKGYFIFYEQNRQMQEYLADLFPEDRVEKESLPDKAIKSFRKKIEGKEQKRAAGFLKIASSFFVVTVLVIGTIAVNRLDEIRNTSGFREEETKRQEPEQQEPEQEVYQQEVAEPLSETALPQTEAEESFETEETGAAAGTWETEDVSATGETQEETEESPEESFEASAQARQIRSSYVIKEGDTLADICTKYYGNLDRLSELCQLNAITDADLVVPGQKIMLP